MPYITQSSYTSRGLFKSGHVQTIYPTLFRTVNHSRAQSKSSPKHQNQCSYQHQYRRERLELLDGDFLDLDWTTHADCNNDRNDTHNTRNTRNGKHKHNGRLAILCHGLESSTDATYMRCMAKACHLSGWDSVGYNFRGCSGEPNRLPHAYHCGLTEDLDKVVQHAIKTDRYRSISLIGFSLGGNLVLKYLGERGQDVAPQITNAAAVSVPCDLADSSIELERWDNWVYKTRFLRLLVSKSKLKKALISQQLGQWPSDEIRSIKDFDEYFTAPLNNFRGADHYYETTSSIRFLSQIQRPTLLLNAKNDPLLGENCYPYSIAENNAALYLETPLYGGHVGFIQDAPDDLYWHEQRILEFLNSTQA